MRSVPFSNPNNAYAFEYVVKYPIELIEPVIEKF